MKPMTGSKFMKTISMFSFLLIIISMVTVNVDAAYTKEDLTDSIGAWDNQPIFYGFEYQHYDHFTDEAVSSPGSRATVVGNTTFYRELTLNDTSISAWGTASVVEANDTDKAYLYNDTFSAYGSVTKWNNYYALHSNDYGEHCIEFDVDFRPDNSETRIDYYAYGYTWDSTPAGNETFMRVGMYENGTLYTTLVGGATTYYANDYGYGNSSIFHLGFGRHWDVVDGLEVYGYIIFPNGSTILHSYTDETIVAEPSGDAQLILKTEATDGQNNKILLDNIMYYDVDISSDEVLTSTSSLSKALHEIFQLIVPLIAVGMIVGVIKKYN